MFWHLHLRKGQMNLITTVKVQVSSPPIIALTTQTALTNRQNIIHRSPPPPQKFGAITIVTLYEVPTYQQPERQKSQQMEHRFSLRLRLHCWADRIASYYLACLVLPLLKLIVYFK